MNDGALVDGIGISDTIPDSDGMSEGEIGVNRPPG